MDIFRRYSVPNGSLFDYQHGLLYEQDHIMDTVPLEVTWALTSMVMRT